MSQFFPALCAGVGFLATVMLAPSAFSATSSFEAKTFIEKHCADRHKRKRVILTIDT